MYKSSTKKWVKVKTIYDNSVTISTDAYKNKLIPCYGYKFRVAPFIRKTSSASGKNVNKFVKAYNKFTFIDIYYRLFYNCLGQCVLF